MTPWPVRTRLYSLGYEVAYDRRWLQWALYYGRRLVWIGALATILALPARLWNGEEIISE